MYLIVREKNVMSDYLLYGTKMIENDATLKDFAQSVYNNIPMEAIMEDSEERRVFILESVEAALKDDISRTDIDYEGLIYKYRNEFGDLFYKMWDKDYRIPTMECIGEGAKRFFNDIVYYYIAIHYDELVDVEEKLNDTSLLEQEQESFQEERDYYVSYSGSNVVRSLNADEACERALNELSIDEINAYPMNENGEIDMCRE